MIARYALVRPRLGSIGKVWPAGAGEITLRRVFASTPRAARAPRNGLRALSPHIPMGKSSKALDWAGQLLLAAWDSMTLRA